MRGSAGNRTDKARTIASVTTHETPILASTSNRLTQVQNGSGGTLRTFTYSAGGDLSQDAVTAGATYNYGYNARKRLVSAGAVSGDAGTYGYDYLGRRVWRTVVGNSATVRTHYIFDPQGHLLAEHDGATGAVLREYVWLDDMPVAMIDSTGGTPATYYVHTGQIEEPLVMTDASKAKVWDAYVEPFGAAQVFGTPSAGLDLRLPGQFTQAETGALSQNWNRDYDTSLGRYVEADPLGIEAGQNVYGYVGGNPLAATDPSGLQLRSVLQSLIPPPVPGTSSGSDLTMSQIMQALGIGQAEAINQAPSGITPKQTRYFDKYCRNAKDPCAALKAQIQKAIQAARNKMETMLDDPLDLYAHARNVPNPSLTGSGTTWHTHGVDLAGRINAINQMIQLGRSMGCDMSAEQRAANSLWLPGSPR